MVAHLLLNSHENETNICGSNGRSTGNSSETCESADQRWSRNYASLKLYVEEYGETPPYVCIYHDVNIGVWCSRQRHDQKRGKLAESRIKQLQEIPGWQ
jgi:hypothetical protein